MSGVGSCSATVQYGLKTAFITGIFQLLYTFGEPIARPSWATTSTENIECTTFVFWHTAYLISPASATDTSLIYLIPINVVSNLSHESAIEQNPAEDKNWPQRAWVRVLCGIIHRMNEIKSVACYSWARAPERLLLR